MRGRNCRWEVSGSFENILKRSAGEFGTFWYLSYGCCWLRLYGFDQKTVKKMTFTLIILKYVYQNVPQNKSNSEKWFWESNIHAYERLLRIFKNSWKISKPDSQGIGPKFWYLQNQPEFTDSFPTFGNKKIAHRKKLWRFQIPEFNLCIAVLSVSTKLCY